jgi:hypothetical protein
MNFITNYCYEKHQKIYDDARSGSAEGQRALAECSIIAIGFSQ